MRENKFYQVIALDWKEFSEEARDQFAEAFKELGKHLGDVEQELYGEAQSDTFILYLADRKASKKHLKALSRGGWVNEKGEVVN